jgi:dienelactone hydrolase
MKKLLTTLTFFVILLIVVPSLHQAKEAKPKISIIPARAVYAAPFNITISGLSPGEEVLLKAASVDKSKIRWESSASFKANRQGVIELTKQAPIAGDYHKVDHLGLLWSMKPINSKRNFTYFNYDTDQGLIINFTLIDSKGNHISQKLYRFYEDPKNPLFKIELNTDGLKGTLFSPSSHKKYPGVILLSGSNGGSVHWLAKAIAYHGFSVLDLPYFKYPDLPKDLINIPIEYFQKAIQWLKDQKTVKKGKIGLIGGSRGGELALLLGSMFDEFKVIVGWVPAAHLWQGENYEKLVPTWTYQGKPLPYIGEEFSKDELKKFYSGQMTSFRGYFLNTLKNLDPSLIDAATIPVEKIKAPVLLISGKDDQTWPSFKFSNMIMERLKKHNFKYEYCHFAAENAGHMVFLPDFITATYRHFNGGTRESELHNSIKSWNDSIKFLHKYLD